MRSSPLITTLEEVCNVIILSGIALEDFDLSEAVKLICF